MHDLRHVRTAHPSRSASTCQDQTFEWVDLPGTGTIYTLPWCDTRCRPQLAEVVPYVSGVVELDGTQGAGARMLLNITDCDPETVKIGDKVEIWFDKVSETFPCPGPG